MGARLEKARGEDGRAWWCGVDSKQPLPAKGLPAQCCRGESCARLHVVQRAFVADKKLEFRHQGALSNRSSVPHAGVRHPHDAADNRPNASDTTSHSFLSALTPYNEADSLPQSTLSLLLLRSRHPPPVTIPIPMTPG